MYLKTLSQFIYYSGLITRTARAMKTNSNTFAVYIMFINKHMWPNLNYYLSALIFWIKTHCPHSDVWIWQQCIVGG